MIHDQTASVLSLARNVLQGVDPSQIETKVSTASLVLLLETLIAVGTPAHQSRAGDAAARTVMGQMAALGGK
jgi:hypothetical protein